MGREGGRQSPAHLRQVRSRARKVPVSDWEVRSKGRLPQGLRLSWDQVKAQRGRLRFPGKRVRQGLTLKRVDR